MSDTADGAEREIISLLESLGSESAELMKLSTHE